MSFKVADAYVSVDFRTDNAELSLRRALDNMRGEVKVDADTAQADAKIAATQREANRLDGDKVHVQVDADTAGADASLAVTNAEVSRLDGRRANVTVDADVAGALAKIALVSAAIASLPAIAVAGLGGLAGAGAALGGALGVAATSAIGLKDAVTQLGKSTGGGGGAAADSAGKHLQLASAMDRVKSAQAALVNTQANAADQIRRADQAIVDAKERLQRAYDDAAVSAASSARRVADAEENLADAQRTARMAQEDLTRARQDASRQLEDLQQRVEDLALSEESAALSVREAEQRLAEVRADGRSTELEKARAELSYRESLNRLEDIRIEQQRTAEDKAAADAKGVEGSDQVRDAQQRIADAQEGIRDAEQGVADARSQAARDAESQADRIRDAQQRVTEAELAAAATRRQAAFSVAQAKQSVVDAERALQQAQQQSASGGGGGANPLAEAMAKLGPNARAFAVFLRGFIDGPLRELRQAGQEQFLPGIQRGLTQIIPLMQGPLKTAFAGFSKTVGDALGGLVPILANLAIPFLKFADTAMRGLAPLGPVLADFTARFAAMTERVAGNGVLERAMGAFVQMIGAVLNALPPLIEAGLELMTVIGPPLADLFTALIPLIIALAQAVGPVLAQAMRSLIPVVGAVTEAIREHPELFGQIVLALGTLVPAVGGLMKAFDALKPVMSAVKLLFAANPAVLWVAGIAAVAAGVIYAYQHSAIFRARLAELWAALQHAGDVIRANVEPALRGLWQTISTELAPAFTHLLENITPIATFLVNVLSPAIAGFLQQLVSQAAGAIQIFSFLIDGVAKLIGLIPGIHDADDATKRFGDSVKEMGEKGKGAKSAADGLNIALGETRRASEDAATAQDRLRDAMNRGKQESLDLRGAETSYYDALARTKEAIRQNGATLDVTTEKGRANRRSLDDLAARHNAYSQQLATSSASEKTLQGYLASSRQSFIQTATQMGATKAQAKALADQVLQIPKKANTAVSVTGYTDTMSKLQQLITRIAYVNGQLREIQVNANAANVREDRVAARAKGGPVQKGVPYVVGEERPELFVPDENGTIIPDLGLVRRSLAPLSQRPDFQAADATAGGGRVVNFNGDIIVQAPPGSLDMASAADRKRFAEAAARDIRDAIVRLEGAER